MEPALCCRACLAEVDLSSIFAKPEHHEKYTQVILEATGVQMSWNDRLPQQMCATCITFINQAIKFRKKCREAHNLLMQRLNQNDRGPHIELVFVQSDEHSIDISDLVETADPNVTGQPDNITDDVDVTEVNVLGEDGLGESESKDCNLTAASEEVETHKKKRKGKEKPVKRVMRPRRAKKEAGEGNAEDKEADAKEKENGKEKGVRQRERIECEQCHKVLTSRLSLRNHYKIHTGFDIVCEHCGKRFITRRLLLMHCKAKHGYEKTDRCSFCDYRASNAEQVKIHERVHTGERPYACGEGACAATFARRSTALQHRASHRAERAVPCAAPHCPQRFKSHTLMRIHTWARHGAGAAARAFSCSVCAHTCRRRRALARHLARAHGLAPAPHLIRRTDLRDAQADA